MRAPAVQVGGAGSKLPPAFIMFVGSINSDCRSILAETAHQWASVPIYVGCSGNFTVERILASQGHTDLNGNDVSLYSCALGSYLAGVPFRLEVADRAYDWIAPFITTDIHRIATLLLCSEMLKFDPAKGHYHQRMFDAYRHRFPQMHQGTVEKIGIALEGIRLRSFYAGDVFEHLKSAPDDAAIICFPPTYKGGYERMYRAMDAAFSWDKPTYPMFDEARWEELSRWMTNRRHWMTLRDHPCEHLQEHLIGRVQTTPRSKPVYIYASAGTTRLTMPRTHTEPVLAERADADLSGPLSIAKLSGRQLNFLRAEYLGKNIAPAGAWLSLAVLVGGKLAGAIAFAKPGGITDWVDAYMLSDFSAAPNSHPRISKLIVAAALSTEVKAVIEQQACRRIESIGTTAFTDRPVSMKYRGLLELHSRKPGQLNYKGPAGQWSLSEAKQWWMNRFMTASPASTADSAER